MIIYISVITIILFILCVSALVSSLISFFIYLLTKNRNLKNTFLVSLAFILITLIAISLTLILCANKVNTSVLNVFTYLIFDIISTIKFLKDTIYILIAVLLITFIFQAFIISFVRIDNNPIITNDNKNALGQNEQTSLAIDKRRKINLIDITITTLLTSYSILFVILIFAKIGTVLSNYILK